MSLEDELIAWLLREGEYFGLQNHQQVHSVHLSREIRNIHAEHLTLPEGYHLADVHLHHRAHPYRVACTEGSFVPLDTYAISPRKTAPAMHDGQDSDLVSFYSEHAFPERVRLTRTLSQRELEVLLRGEPRDLGNTPHHRYGTEQVVHTALANISDECTHIPGHELVVESWIPREALCSALTDARASMHSYSWCFERRQDTALPWDAEIVFMDSGKEMFLQGYRAWTSASGMESYRNPHPIMQTY